MVSVSATLNQTCSNICMGASVAASQAHLRNGKQPLSFKGFFVFLCFANMRNAMHKLD